ncbi:MAG TPA: VOC family protein [Terriglobia bacterium]|nr:VOC family protein [Terriglobia bacterium]
MPKPSLSGQLDVAVQAVLDRRAQSPAPEMAESAEARRFYTPPRPRESEALPERIRPLLALIEDLADLPREEFRTHLKNELERNAPMMTTAKTAPEKSPVRPVPEGYLTVAPHLTIKGAAAAIDFYKKAFGAAEVMRLTMPDGTLGHAEIKIGDSVIMLSDEFPDYGNLGPQSVGGSPVRIHLYVEDVDALAAQAAAAGATITNPAADRDYGERSAVLTDPFGHLWAISTHLEDMTFEQYRQRHASHRQGEGSERIPADSVKPASPVRPGFHSANAQITVSDGPRAIEFYKRAFGAVERESMRFGDPEGDISHAELTIGDSGIMIQSESEEYHRRGPLSLGGTPVKIHLFVEDVDALAAQAIAAGAKVLRPVEDQFYGDRAGQLEDPFGHRWIISTHIEDITPEEIERRAAAFVAGTAPKPATERELASAASKEAVRPADFTSVTPYLAVRGAVELLDFLKNVLGATETSRHPDPSGGIMHAEVRIGNSMLMVGGSPGMTYPETPAALHTYVDDVDAVYRRALEAGSASIHEPADMDYGERGASVKDPFGNHWYLATPLAGQSIPKGLRNVTPTLHPRGAAGMIEFLKQAFGAEEVVRYANAAGVIQHAQVKIGDAVIELGEAHGPYQPMPSALYVSVADVDATHQRAVAAGAAVVRPPADQPYGVRMSWVTDPFGVHWYITKPLEK